MGTPDSTAILTRQAARESAARICARHLPVATVRADLDRLLDLVAAAGAAEDLPS